MKELLFMVEVVSVEDAIESFVICTEPQLATFITHYDTEHYKIMNVACLGEVTQEHRTFYKQDQKLELG